jgi:hypothetical protein
MLRSDADGTPGKDTRIFNQRLRENRGREEMEAPLHHIRDRMGLKNSASSINPTYLNSMAAQTPLSNLWLSSSCWYLRSLPDVSLSALVMSIWGGP